MKLLIRSGHIISPSTPANNKVQDILLDNGIIINIGENIDAKNADVIDANGKLIFPGLMDMQVDFSDPGHEFREDIESGSAALLSGGMATAAIMPHTSPVIDNKSQVGYILQHAGKNNVNLLPITAISKGCEGKYLTEMIDLANSGAVAFTDKPSSLQNGDLLIKAMQYSLAVNVPILLLPEDPTIGTKGVMHEGVMNTKLGLRGIPSMAEETMVNKCLSLCRYSGAQVHFTLLSSAEGIARVKEAKKEGLPVTAGVSIYHLLFTDDDLHDFDTNLKLSPPIRSRKDRDALIKGVLDGTIDVVVSNHHPLENDLKKCEFSMAAFGAIGTQILLPKLYQVIISNGGSAELLCKLLSENPRKILALPQREIKEGTEAEFTIFDADLEWDFNVESNLSKSVNSSFYGRTIKGKALYVVNKEIKNTL